MGERVSEEPAFLFLKTKDGRGFYFAYGDRSNAGIGKYLLGQKGLPKKIISEKRLRNFFIILMVSVWPNGQCGGVKRPLSFGGKPLLRGRKGL